MRTYSPLPAKQNRGNRSHHKHRVWTAGQRNFGDALGAFNLRDWGGGADALAWQSDILPEQVTPRPNLRNEQLLMLAVLENAIADARLYTDGPLRREARRWIADQDETWPFSFLNICEALGFDGEYIRAGLKRETRAA